jgi:hypothetical protein
MSSYYRDRIKTFKKNIFTDVVKEMISELIFHRKYKEKTKEWKY